MGFRSVLLGFTFLFGVSAVAQGMIEEELRLKNEEELEMDMSLGYTVLTDMADTESQKIYHNSLGLDLDLFFQGWRASLAASVNYKAVDREVQADQNDVDFYFQDLGFGLSRGIWKDSNNALTTMVGYLAPVSQSSRNLGVNGVFEGDLRLLSRFFDRRLTLSNTLSALAIVNTYYFSPVDEEVNQSAGYGYDFGISWKLTKDLSFGLGAGTRLSQYVDSSTTFRFRNSASLRYSYNDYLIFGYWRNGSYLDQTDLDLWYVDQYRQIVGVGLSVAL